ncbi:EGF-like domain-containing protein [Caenorhabditis elegans]|uniref:EGF-like domain-containing protein n=1 Tax=Caenorhabditis elegans TaxID=6239 RepID=Q20852_CAEEL|nr:EGF-like domain-containing protein [Caenorhabditis elegans]CCD69400.2 EGF-like domain-containing protein [Caenorhabditis elegans]|eukprot:NP_501207.2 EGF plus ASC domain ion channel [Caenorhabditis elegans]
MLLLWFFLPLTLAQIDTPYDCGAHGYCYPANRTSATTCSECTCSDESTQTSDTTCTAPTSCSPNPCTLSNQQCNMVNDIPTCTCAVGYTGTDCTMLTSDPCSPQPCLQNGVCSSSGGTYSCACATGFFGEQCQYSGDPCSGYCSNGGTCEMLFSDTTPYCQCPFDYYGDKCQTTRSVQTSYVGCFDDSSASFSDYYVYSTTITTGTDCRDALISYREANPTSNYAYSTMSGTTGECLFSTANALTDPPTGGGLLVALLNALLSTCAYSNLNSGFAAVYSLNDLCTPEPCGEAAGNGKCIQTSATAYTCLCNPIKTGSACQSDATLTPCASIDCGVGTCGVTDDQIGYYCLCASTNQTVACVGNPCTSEPCLYGGTCSDLGNGSYSCACLNLYMDTNCETFDSCYINKCENGGTCVPTYNLLDSTFTCQCTPDWKGTYCEEERYYCDETPCENGGECEDIIGPPNSYNCTCTPQWTGFNCTIDVDECVEDTTLCKTKDPDATCVNTNGSYYCVCSPNMFGKSCLFNKIIYQILNATYGDLGPDKLDEMAQELTNDPTLVRDIVPFLIGGYSLEVRTSLSWTAADMFLWVAYEQQLIDLNSNFVQWNDKVLGNCFTFNHMNSSFKYEARSSGYPGGLEMQMNVKQDEYLPWTETAGVMVFTSTKEEAVTSESVRINTAPHFESRIAINRVDYYRLGGRYGVCINSVSEVKSYYYDGDYTTDGCLRSCYQDVVNGDCGCMDPRYPMPNDGISCSISQKTCIDELVDSRGDPSTWPECTCPLPCSQTVYTSKLSRLPYVNKIVDCEEAYTNKTACYETFLDSVILRISLPKLDYMIYSETPAMDLTKFMSYLGGILSILIGVSIVSFVELFFLFVQLIVILLFNKRL